MPAESREFGSYRLVRRLGVGGMAETFEAVRVGNGGFEQRVCLKRVLPAYGQDSEFVERFRREAQLVATLRHSNVVGVTDFGEVDGVSYMALELVDGVDLRSFLKSRPNRRLSSDMVAWIGLDIAYALEHAHERIIHRDVSPSNVLISRTGEAKLADFGIAKAIESANASASIGAQGKVPYMAPEQIRGEPADPRSDLFSLGVVLFEALSGTRPFDGAHDIVTMQRIVEGKRVDLAEVAQDAPAALRACIENLLAIEQDERPPSATALTEALAAIDPSPDARRALAAEVEAQRGGPSTRMHVRARREEPDTDLSPAADVPVHRSERVPAISASPRRRLAGVAVALMGIAAVGFVWFVTPAAQDVPTSPAVPALPAASPAEPSSTRAPSTPTATAPLDGDETASETPAASTPATAARKAIPGWVHVIVQPWGNVWIDGVFMGRAPVKARVTEGRHIVEVGRDLPSKKQRIHINPGARKTLELQLNQ